MGDYIHTNILRMNEILKRRLEGIREILLTSHRAGAGLPNAVIGSEREIFIREFLEKSLPVHYRFGTGCVTDMNSNTSGQLDIVVELPFAPSFQMPNGLDRLYLAEAIGAVVETKSNLSAQWEQAMGTVTKYLQVRRYALGGLHSMAHGSYPDQRSPIFIVGYEGWSSHETLEAKLNGLPPAQRPDGVLDITAGVLAYFKNIDNEKEKVTVVSGNAASLFALSCLMLELMGGRAYESGDLNKYFENLP